MAQGGRLDYIGSISNDSDEIDTVPHADLLKLVTWDVRIISSNGSIREMLTKEPDTIPIKEPVTIKMTGQIRVNERLEGRLHALHYRLIGSLLVKLQGDTIAKAGTFAGLDYAANSFHDEYVNFIFKDTAEQIEITYLPQVASHQFTLRLEMGQLSWATEKTTEAQKDEKKSMAMGFYFLAFAIIFIIFYLYYRERIENAYFALFCLFASLAFLWGNLKVGIMGDTPGIITAFLFATLSFQFLSIFFAKVLRNKTKSKIPLILIIVVTIFSFHPRVCYFTSTTLNFTGHDNPFVIVEFSLMIIFLIQSISSCCLHLFKGFRQKQQQWEAKTIAVFWLLTLLITAVAPKMMGSNLRDRLRKQSHLAEVLLDNFTEIGYCIYPLSVALVLGRRNGENHSQLISQIKSIEQLSVENLEKEKEKKQILENLNTQLEQRVNERTLEVMQQKEVIELKSKAITDNINYAQRIQSAILPDISRLQRMLPDSLILFLPKDIVSGDFYSFLEKADKVLLVAGDCTGHGVSGAFMSLIASSLLNQIINERGVTEPAEILNQLNISVIDTLRQSENESHDGMDIAICAIDMVTMEMQYAGANRPLWLVRDKQLEVHKPDKFPIGGLQVARERIFSSKNIQLQRGDTFYLFTDGYADQFGGKLGKKMMTAKFKEILTSIHGLPMAEQKAFLSDHFTKWKGDHEQVDDVLVLGVGI